MNTAVHFSSATPEWATPQDFFDMLNAEFHFDLDPCSTHENAKCFYHFTREDDGLSKEWSGHRVFCNPPYGREIGPWVAKCATGGVPSPSHYFRRAPTRVGSTIIFTEKPRYVL